MDFGTDDVTDAPLSEPEDERIDDEAEAADEADLVSTNEAHGRSGMPGSPGRVSWLALCLPALALFLASRRRLPEVARRLRRARRGRSAEPVG